MTPTEAREIIGRLDWSQMFLAELLGRNQTRIRRQFRGKEPFDEPLAEWLADLGRLVSNPPPTRKDIRVMGVDGELGEIIRALGMTKHSVATYLGYKDYGDVPGYPLDLDIKEWLRKIYRLTRSPPPKSPPRTDLCQPRPEPPAT